VKVYVTPEVFAKVKKFRKLASPDEICMFGVVEIIDKEPVITDVFLPEQEGSYTSNDVTPQAYAKLIDELYSKHGISPNSIRAHIHTHPNGLVGPSEVDDGTAERLFCKYPYYITGVYDGEEFVFHVNIGEPFKLRVEADWGFYVPLDTKELEKEFKKKFKRKVRTHPVMEKGRTRTRKTKSNGKLVNNDVYYNGFEDTLF